MCGIAGLTGPSDERVITTMTRTMIHRGPDDEGFYLDDGIALGVRRLSIIDVSGGRQPATNEDGSLVVVMNGEIYNYRELKHRLEQRGHRFRTGSDTEVLPHLYEEYGDQAVHLLRGMFTFALWDRPRRRLLVARDRLGIKPCFYAHANGKLVFASEAKALLCHPDVRPEVDFEGLDLYLTFGYVPGPESIFRGVKKLPPGHLLIHENGQSRLQRYWTPVIADTEPGTRMADAGEEFQHLFDEAVRLHLVSDVPVGVLLSGGLDSSAVVSAMTRGQAGPVRTFTVGFDSPEMTDERADAKLVARHFAAEHHEVVVAADVAALLPKIVWHLDEPVADPAALPTFLICQHARKTVPVVLTGEGSDEILAGYPRYSWFRTATELQRLVPSSIRGLANTLAQRAPVGHRYRKAASDLLADGDDVTRHLSWIGNVDSALKNQLLTPQLRAELGDAPREKVALHLGNGNTANHGDPLNRLLKLDMQTWMVDDVLTKMDRMSMAASVEARVPFLDHRLVDYATGLPGTLKIRGREGKQVLRHAMRNVLPPAPLVRRKKAFNAPINHWLRHPLRDMVGDTLLSPRARQRGWLDDQRVQGIVAAHAAGDDRYGRPLWTLLCLELWARTFLDGSAGAHLS
jgi:asparagine synthase (glutamine-hydrolysing)